MQCNFVSFGAFARRSPGELRFRSVTSAAHPRAGQDSDANPSTRLDAGFVEDSRKFSGFQRGHGSPDGYRCSAWRVVLGGVVRLAELTSRLGHDSVSVRCHAPLYQCTPVTIARSRLRSRPRSHVGNPLASDRLRLECGVRERGEPAEKLDRF